tara:strand:+ start:623 stop:1024 length:402 start_codon:yes stop_codon:yes gene_type:complete
MVGKTAIKDNALKKDKINSKNLSYNLKSKLLKENKINKEFLEILRFVSLEDLITLKLLVSSEAIKGKLYNFPFLKYTSDICREAVVRFAISMANNRREASLILGSKKADILKYIKAYNLIEEYNYDSRTKKNK